MKPSTNYAELAVDQTKKGGDPEKAKVFALLAIAEAVSDLAAELRGLGTEAQPVCVREV